MVLDVLRRENYKARLTECELARLCDQRSSSAALQGRRRCACQGERQRRSDGRAAWSRLAVCQAGMHAWQACMASMHVLGRRFGLYPGKIRVGEGKAGTACAANWVLLVRMMRGLRTTQARVPRKRIYSDKQPELPRLNCTHLVVDALDTCVFHAMARNHAWVRMHGCACMHYPGIPLRALRSHDPARGTGGV